MKRSLKIKIEKNVPLPARNLSTRLEKIREMKVGDSFLIPSTWRFNVPSLFERVGYKATTRATEKNQHRVWRIK